MDPGLAQFPDFEPVSIKSKPAIENIVAKFPPYSDFNFVSMYSWNVDNQMLVSHLNNNLVVRFKDYTSDKAFLSFIGETDIDQTIKQLLSYAQSNGLAPTLHLIPEQVIELIEHPESYNIEEDRDSHDYIVLALKFRQLEGKEYASKRNSINRFKADHGHHATTQRLQIDDKVASQIMETVHRWRQESGKPSTETENEFAAVEKLIKNAGDFDLHTLGIYINESMVAFSIYELLPGNYALGHFEKALKVHPGLYSHLKHATASHLHDQGVTHINYEQDLGLENLRKAKMLLKPETFLKKFTVSLAAGAESTPWPRRLSGPGHK
jgi:hypothetical protein